MSNSNFMSNANATDIFTAYATAINDKADNNEVAPEFNNTTAYSAGELVYKDGQLYKFDSDHAAGAWDASEVSPTTVAAEFNQLKNTLTSVEETVDELRYNNLSTSSVNLKEYTSTRYEVPSDGYIYLAAYPTSNASAYIRANICGNNELNNMLICAVAFANSSNGFNSIFVKKGMKVKIDANTNPTSNNVATFTALVP